MIHRFHAASDTAHQTIPDNLDGSPPPYTEDPPFILTETRTTRTEVITTTTTTTSTTANILPNVKLDVGGYTTLGVRAVKSVTSDATSPSFLQLDKALPPTPRSTSLSFDFSSDFRIHSSAPASPTLASSALACAIAAVGSKHISSRNILSPGVATEGNVTVASPPSSVNTRRGQLPLGMRRAKSTQRFPTPGDTDQLALVAENARPRSRGVSFGAVSFLSSSPADSKGKGKEKDIDLKSTPPPQEAPRSLSRKSSFWSRKKMSNLSESPKPAPQPDPLPTVDSQPPQLPPLPIMSSVSSFELSELSQKSSASSSHHRFPRNLLRRHSEKLLSSYFIHPPKADLPTKDVQNVPLVQIDPEIVDVMERSVSDSKPFPQTDGPDESHSSGLTKRHRAQTNPPLLRRLSTTILSFTDTPTTPPLPKASISLCASPISTPQVVIPKPSADTELPSVYVDRLRSVVSKAEMAGILASSSDPFYVQALRYYLQQFNFYEEPLDIALRKLLMEVGLPRETQQIDRVMEAFSSRYTECNPGLFSQADHAYVLAFSLIMLHTDAFNRSNKNKMNKADYIKNTTMPGVSPDVLGCFYDNIVFAPFILIEDPLDINGQVGLTPEAVSKKLKSPLTPSNGGLLGKNKIDPYYLIINNILQSMRTEIDAIIPLDEPFDFQGTAGPWDAEEMQHAFSDASIIDVDASFNRPIFTMTPSGDPVFMKPTKANSVDTTAPSSSSTNILTLKITKVGLLNRKDDITGRGRKTAIRKWKTWTVILTGSQLLFFRDPSMATQLLDHFNSASDEVPSIAGGLFKPDELLSVKDAISVYDRTYAKHENTFRFVLSDGRQILLQAPSEQEMNEWLSRINYASAFKSAGVRMRPAAMSQRDIQLTGVAAATSHLRDVQLHSAPPSTPLQAWAPDAPLELMGMLSGDPFSPRSTSKHRLTIAPSDDVDLDHLSIIQSGNTEQFDATFNQVKCDLSQVESLIGDPILVESTPTSPLPASRSSRASSRSDIIQLKLHELDIKLVATQSQLDSDMRVIRNIAILRPFQRGTRVRLLNAVQGFARRVTLLRLDAMRLECHITVLRNDLEDEARSWDQTKEIALEAAKRTLHHRRSDIIPRMTISVYDSEDAHTPASVSSEILSRSWSNSSTSGSFCSALEYGSDWPTADDDMDPTPTSLAPSYSFDSPRPSPSPYPSADKDELRSSGPEGSGGGSHQESARVAPQIEDEAEEAEVWNKTRCAKRVSLIQVPSALSFPNRLERRN